MSVFTKNQTGGNVNMASDNQSSFAGKELSLYESDIICALNSEEYVNQRHLAEITGHSLGVINKALTELTGKGYIDEEYRLTDISTDLLRAYSPRSAVILAAGNGIKMIPLDHYVPKALLEIKGECLIERQIKQLREAGVEDIYIVVGFMKESFEYLIDMYDVKLLVNRDYDVKNNLSSLDLVADKICNTYIVPCDIWCKSNPFSKNEIYSWYLASEEHDEFSNIRINRKNEPVLTSRGEPGNKLLGISYISEKDAKNVASIIHKMAAEHRFDRSFWEDALMHDGKMMVAGRIAAPGDYVEINSYEQVMKLDSDPGIISADALNVIKETFGCSESDIKDMELMKKGMTNRSFSFVVNNVKYLIRIPGEGTELLVDRNKEAAVFKAISGLGLCDDPVYINPINGYKITRYLEAVRVCDPQNRNDLTACMNKLRDFHNMKLKVDHDFDLFDQINLYESFWNGNPSAFRDYAQTKKKIFSLKGFLDSLDKERCLTHIDAICDNFLFHPLPDGSEGLQLTDWEYSGMQDPHVDIAMFCIYSLYDKSKCDNLIDMYFEGQCDKVTRAKIYCYIAICGLLWSNWCDYKRIFGIEFGEYHIKQYRYAKEYYRYAMDLIEEKHTVKRAVIMAAGKGERLHPVTLQCPKPLIDVNGRRMIDTIIDSLHINGIFEIYVVVGYLKEAFKDLPSDYPGVVLIENPYFDTCNNISSLYVARDHLEEAIILDGDQIVYDPSILSSEFDLSGYNAVRCTGSTKEWLLQVNDDNVITSCSRNGGSNGWVLYSVSRWTAEDGAKLRGHVEEQFENGNTDIYWDDVPMFCYREEYQLGIRPMNKTDIIEIDDIDELREVDSKYREVNYK